MKRLLPLVALLPLMVFALDAPVVSIICEVVGDSTEVTLSWMEVPDASQYCVYVSASDPYDNGELVECVDQPPFVTIFENAEERFFYVVAEDTPEPPLGFTLIPAGTFMMGSDEGSAEEQPVHQVTLTHDFYLGTHEVTNQEYLVAVQWAFDQGLVSATSSTVQVDGDELLDLDDVDCEIAFDDGMFSLVMLTHVYGSYGPGFAYSDGYDPSTQPVKQVTWNGAVCYCDWLSEVGGLPPFYQGNWDQTPDHNPYEAEGYRLPTEAEWEYAASYSDGRIYPWGNESPNCYYANFRPSGYCVGWTSPVGSYFPGASYLGLMDMAGNLWEWVGDNFDPEYYEYSPETDPLGAEGGFLRVIRGGYWYVGEGVLRCAARSARYPFDGSREEGFRIARTANP